MKTAKELNLNPQDLWIERTNHYGHYKVCLIGLDGANIHTHIIADSELWDRYNRTDDPNEGLDILLSSPSINHWVCDNIGLG